MKIRPVLLIGCVAAMVIATGPQAVEARPVGTRGAVKQIALPVRSTTTRPLPPVAAPPVAARSTSLGPGLGGVGGTGFRHVADVLRNASAARGPAAASLDPSLVAVADDPTAFVDSDGRLLYIDQFDTNPSASSSADPPFATASEPEVAAGVSYPLDNTFGLQSRPGSSKTIFLDFDGYTVTGTAWNQQTTIGSQTVAPYDYDGVVGRSTTDEQYIRAIWQMVSDDYAAFDVNVTTQQPSDDALYRSSPGDPTYGAIAVITPTRWLSPSGICGSGCGGVAYVNITGNSFPAGGTGVPIDRYYAPAWVFSSNGQWSSVADTISHEVGHNLGLNHDGLVNTGVSPCITASEYFGGNGSGVGSWGPIMGAPFGRQYSQWSRGEYNCASQTQDDVSIIAAKTGFVPDESSSIGNAVALPPTETPTPDQVIGFAGDIDYFAINVTTGYLRAIVTRSINGTSLLPRFAILNNSGMELVSGFLSSTSSGFLEVSSLAPGTYYVSVTGAGFGSPQSGFSNYASFGYYNVVAQTLSTPNPPSSLLLSAAGNQTFTASWAASASLSSLAPLTYAVSLCNASTAVCSSPIDTTSTSVQLSAPTPTGSFYFSVNGRHSSTRVSTNASSAQASVQTAPIAPAPIRLVFNESTDTVTVVWGGEQQFAPVTVTGRTLTVMNRSTGLPIVIQSVAAGGSLNFTTALADVWLDASFVSQTAFGAPWNASLPSPVGSVFLGRIAAPQTPGTTVPGRPSAPQTSGTTVPGRPSAPQV